MVKAAMMAMPAIAARINRFRVFTGTRSLGIGTRNFVTSFGRGVWGRCPQVVRPQSGFAGEERECHRRWLDPIGGSEGGKVSFPPSLAFHPRDLVRHAASQQHSGARYGDPERINHHGELGQPG